MSLAEATPQRFPIPVGPLILGWLCIAGGMVATFDFASSLLLGITNDTSLGVVLLPIGVGILRGSAQVLGIATALLCVIASLCVFRLAVFAGNAIGYSDISLAPKSTVRWLALMAILGLTIVSRIMLSSPEAERWFRSKHDDSAVSGRLASSRGQFGLIAILALTFFSAVVFTRLQSPAYTYLPMNIRRISVPTTVDRSYVHFGTRERRSDRSKELVFVLFQTESRTVKLPGRVEESHPAGQYDPQLNVYLPDPREEVLPGDAQLYRMHDGVLSQVDGRVRLSQLNVYLRTRPTKLDLQDLINTR